MQLHSKSGFIFYNNFSSGIYYSTSEYERCSSTISPRYHSWEWAIYLIKHFTSLSLTDIGQLFKDEIFSPEKTTPKELTQTRLDSVLNYKSLNDKIKINHLKTWFSD